MYNKEIKVTKVSEQNRQTFQYAIWKTSSEKFNATIIGIYHPPYSVTNKITNTQFIDEFLNWLLDQIMEHRNIIITGDINLHLNNTEDVDGSMLLDNLEVLGLESHCRSATHKMGNTSDVFFTEIASDITISSCTPGPFISDHCMVECTTSMPQKDIIKKSVTFRKIKDIDTVQFAKDVENHPLLNTEDQINDIDILVTNLESALRESLNSHAPERSKVITCRPKCPWYTDDLKHQKGVVRHRERIWRKYREDHHWLAYKSEKRRYNNMLFESKKINIANKVSQCKRDTKQLFKLLSNITSSTKDSPLPDGKSSQDLANQFAEYFINKIQRIRNNLNSYDRYHMDEMVHAQTLGEFKPLSEDEVSKVIMSMASKSCEIDPVPTSLLKEILPQIIKPIAKIINTSLEQGVFASQWKVAIVKPLLKKIGLELITLNY